MGNAFSEPYERVEYQSGASRLLNSIFMAICVAPLLILGMCVLLGWNEQRAVCSQKAISAGRDAVIPVGCDDATAGSGSLVLFTCGIEKNSLPTLQLSNAGDFAAFSKQAIGIKVESYMYQCVEEESKREVKTQGGGKETHYTYTYRKEWKSTPVDSSKFGQHRSQQSRDAFASGCQSRQNDPWPSTVPQTVAKYAEKMKVGAFTTTMTYKVPLETPVSLDTTPSGWRSNGTVYYRSNLGGSPQLGDVKVLLKTNDDPSKLTATVLGQNSQGTIANWTAPSSWLCSGFKLGDLRMGTISKDVLFDRLVSEASSLTWLLRFVGFAVMWIAFGLCFGPLEVAGDCIPCVGPWIGDSIAAITCCVACLPATACTLGVAGLVWMVMRPLIGIPCMLAFVIIIGGFGWYIGKQRAAKRGGQIAGGAPTPNYGSVQHQPPAVATATAVAQPFTPQPPRQMQVQAPLGSYAGQMVQFATPEGTQVSAQVPPGVAPGGFFSVSY